MHRARVGEDWMPTNLIETAWNLPRIEMMSLTSLREDRPVALITGRRSWNAVSNMLDLPLVIQAEPYTADYTYLETLAGGLPPQVRVVYGVGGGLASDVAKYIAWKHKLPCVLIPTALSVDGFFTSLVAVRQNGAMHYQHTPPAEKVVIDMDVISGAPTSVRGTGIVEILSMTTGLLDWRYAAERKRNMPEERFQPWAAGIAAAIAQQAYKIAGGVGAGRPDALRNLLDLICVEVQLTNQLGHNRPQEGSEQYFAQAIEPYVARTAGVPYADLVGPGILIAAALHNQNTASIKETLISAGVRLDQVSEADTIHVLQTLPDYVRQHNLPYSIVHDADLSGDRAQQIVRTAGLFT